MTQDECPVELVVRGRTGRLTVEENAMLSQHVRVCAACALDVQMHASFETDGGRRPGDERMIASAVSAALASRRLRRPGRGRARLWATTAMAAGVILVTAGLASAGVWWLRERAVRQQENPRVAQPAQPPRPKLRVASPAVPEPRVPEAVAPPTSVALLPAPAAPRPRTGGPRVTAPAPAAPVAPPIAPAIGLNELFASANDARRRGDSARAQALYTELQHRFPGTRETRLSFVSLGRLLLAEGAPSAALGQFERYLAEAPSDVLAAEAVYGRARALTAMNRKQEARRSWTELLTRFPESIYADQASHELQQAQRPNE